MVLKKAELPSLKILWKLLKERRSPYPNDIKYIPQLS
jgi:hypothetical protein